MMEANQELLRGRAFLKRSSKNAPKFQISTPGGPEGDRKTKMQSLHDHNESNRLHDVIALLQSGQNIALVSDAGTPLINDPGYKCNK